MQDVRMFQDVKGRIFIQVEAGYWEMTGGEDGNGRKDLLDAARGRTGEWTRKFRPVRRMADAKGGMTMLAEIHEGKFWVFPSFLTEEGRRYLFGNETPDFLDPDGAGPRGRGSAQTATQAPGKTPQP